MTDRSNIENEEYNYLSRTMELLYSLIEAESKKLDSRKREMIDLKKDMWEETTHFSNDFARLTEMNQYNQQVQRLTFNYESTKKKIDMYGGLLESPYFGRLDFEEEGSSQREKIYIGKANVVSQKDGSIAVYDWRAPISSMFYRFEPGSVFFNAPGGRFSGEMTLKRQYKILKSELIYYFDCSLQISDEILQEVLGRNSSPQMRTIIETIQREQDIIIRDTQSDLLIVQGVAGSGKTSIALHRIAFLLYEGVSSKLMSNNILVLSPNDAFGEYIGHVLPELGEENVENSTFDSIIKGCLQDELKGKIYMFHNRDNQLEECITGSRGADGDKVSRWIQFKGSNAFKTILDRYINYYEHKVLKFEDVYYKNKVVYNRQELKSEFLDNKTGMPMVKRLNRIEQRIQESIKELRKERLIDLERIVAGKDDHEFEIKSFARFMLMKDSEAFSKRLDRMTKLDIVSIYEALFKDPKLIKTLAKDIELPEDVDEMIQSTNRRMNAKVISYEDWTAITYLKIKTYGAVINSNIKQVVIDEVQDYYPIQFAIIKEIYRHAKYTVVGDIAQSIERKGDFVIYDEIPIILDKRKTVKLFLNKSYRSSYEINEFTKKIAGTMEECVSFPRYEQEPEIIKGSTKDELDKLMVERINRYFEDGFERVVILCKTFKKAKSLQQRLKERVNIKLVVGGDYENDKACLVMPIYAAKGLEFDAVLVDEVDDTHYKTELDRRLLYIACTRALHRLSLYYCGEHSRYLTHS